MHAPRVRRRSLLALGLAAALARPAFAQGIELVQLQATRSEGELAIDYLARIALPHAVEDAMQAGVPVYFTAEAELRRPRWWWRDERVARVQRAWRVVYQPLTAAWRVGLVGGLAQNYPSLAEALAAISRGAGWRVTDLDRLERGERYVLDFGFRLDTSQLPTPMQFGLGGQGGWAIGAERSLTIEAGQ